MMRKHVFALSLAVAMVAALAGAGIVMAQHEGHEMPEMSPEQQAMMEAMERAGTPGPQHQELAAMAGSWTFEGTFWMDPDTPPMQSTGTAERTVIMDGRVLSEKVSSSFHGQPFEGMAMMGYDNITGKHWSTWIDNMSTAVMTSTGSCSQGKCELHGTMTDPVTGKEMPTRMTAEHQADSEVHRMYCTQDGKEMQTMELKYTRAQ